MKLQGKLTVITGGTSGIGLATAQRFKAEGARVVTNARNAQRLEETKSAHAGLFDDVLQADVTNVSELESFFNAIGEKHGKIDAIFLNAGAGTPGPIDAVTEESFDREFAVNVKGVFFGIQKALPHLHDGASVVINTSVVNQMGMAGFSVYSATKAAVKSFTQSLSAELLDRQIRVNAVSPGPIETPFFAKTGMTEEQMQGAAQGILSRVPLARFGKAEEVAGAVAFLASDDSTYIVGTEIEVDGGMATLGGMASLKG